MGLSHRYHDANVMDGMTDTMWVSDLLGDDDVGWVQVVADQILTFQSARVTFPDTSAWDADGCEINANAVPRRFNIR